MFGSDFWKILKFVIALLKLMAETFGNDDEKKAAKENGF